MSQILDHQTDLDSKIDLINGLDSCAQDLKVIVVSTLNLLKKLKETLISFNETIDNTRLDLKEFQKFLEICKQQDMPSYQLGNELCDRYIVFLFYKVRSAF